MATENVYQALADHLSKLGMGYPPTETLVEILKENFSPIEAQVALAIPTRVIPLRSFPVDKILENTDLDRKEVVEILDDLSVYPHHTMEMVIEKATDFAVCHCSCRMLASLRGRPCDHPTEVCIKFDEVAEYAVARDLGRKISRDEAGSIIRKSEEEGLVHFVDNTEEDIKHNCNCCGCACWNVGSVKRRKIPRDVIMATYFIRETDVDECIGCGECAESCPVDAVTMEEDSPVIDVEWCIGCGVCVDRCPTGAARIVLRPDSTGELPASNFKELHKSILAEKGLI